MDIQIDSAAEGLDQGDRAGVAVALKMDQRLMALSRGCLQNLPPADVYFGNTASILRKQQAIKQLTMAQRRLQHAKAAAWP